MKQLTSPADISQLGTILSFWAHPDDETFTCAGIMAAAVANGQQVICVTATRGEEGVQDESRWPRDQLPEIRTKELDAALSALGIREHFLLDYRDGTLETVSTEEGAAHVHHYVREYQPDTILTFGPEGMTGHPDHQSVSRWVEQAIRDMEHPPAVYHAVELRDHYERFMKQADEHFDIYFNIDEPPIKDAAECQLCFTCNDELCAKKCAALRAMPSQTERMMKDYDQNTLYQMFGSEAFVAANA